VRKLVLAAIERIVNAEAEASGAPRKPEITLLDHYSLTTNDPDATKRVRDALRAHFPVDTVRETRPTMASEDFGSFGAEWHVPSVFWFIGGVDPDVYSNAQRDGTIGALPTNHSPYFAPVIHPTVEKGVAALVVAALAWLGSKT
jgi:hippurate hydrolase